MTDAIICFTTVNKAKEAKRLASKLVSEKLAAYVQIIPKATSIYEWDGALREDQEWLLIIKTVSEKLTLLKEFIVRNHHYEVPELVAIAISDGLPSYLEWLRETVSV